MAENLPKAIDLSGGAQVVNYSQMTVAMGSLAMVVAPTTITEFDFVAIFYFTDYNRR